MIQAVDLVTKRLPLKPLAMEDIHAIFAIAQEKQSIEDFQYAARSLKDVRSWLEPGFLDPDDLLWVIQKGERVIGLFEVCLEAEFSDVADKVCRIGYFLDFREHNQGYATEALRAVVDWLFRTTDVERIEAGVTLHNVASFRILENVGFIREKVVAGNWTRHDQVFDSAYYSLQK